MFLRQILCSPPEGYGTCSADTIKVHVHNLLHKSAVLTILGPCLQHPTNGKSRIRNLNMNNTIIIAGMEERSLASSNTTISSGAISIGGERRKNRTNTSATSTSTKSNDSLKTFDSNFPILPDNASHHQSMTSLMSSIYLSTRNLHHHVDESNACRDQECLPNALRALQTTPRRLLEPEGDTTETRQLSLFLEFAISSQSSLQTNPAGVSSRVLSYSSLDNESCLSNSNGSSCCRDYDDDDNYSIDSIDVTKKRIAKVQGALRSPEDDDQRENVEHRPMTFMMPLEF
jgi:hypothetical protein